MTSVEAAETAIKRGWQAGIFSIVVTLGFTLYVMQVGDGLGTGLSMLSLIDVVLMAGLVFGTYKHSRVCAGLMLAYFLLNKGIQWAAGDFRGLPMAIIFMIFYARALWGTIMWHKLTAEAVPVEVFSDRPQRPAPADGRLFR